MKIEKSLLNLIFGAVVIGIAPILVKSSAVGPIATGFWRLALALPLLAILQVRKQSAKQRVTLKRDYLWLIFAGILFSGDITAWHLALEYTTVAIATVLMNFSPILLALWHWLILKQKPQFKLLLSLLFALLGIVLLVKPSVHMESSEVYGALLALLGAVFYAAYLLIISQARQKFDSVSIIMFSSISSALSMGLMAKLANEIFLPPTLWSWFIVLSLAILVHVLGQGLITQSLASLPVTLSAAVLLIQPLVSSIIGCCLFEESLDWLQMIGILTSLSAIYGISQLR